MVLSQVCIDLVFLSCVLVPYSSLAPAIFQQFSYMAQFSFLRGKFANYETFKIFRIDASCIHFSNCCLSKRKFC
jgi:hypothetical protein